MIDEILDIMTLKNYIEILKFLDILDVNYLKDVIILRLAKYQELLENLTEVIQVEK